MHQELPGLLKLKTNQQLKELCPLTIPTKGEQMQGNFREQWRVENCQRSVSTSNMYEAGGSLYWLEPIVSLGGWHDDAPMVEEASWFDIWEAASVAIPEGVGDQDKLYFGDPFLAFTSVSPDGVRFPSNLRVMRGVVLLQAWYVSMLKAIRNRDPCRIESLHVMALTISIRLYHNPKDKSVSFFVLKSLQNSEKPKLTSVCDSRLPEHVCHAESPVLLVCVEPLLRLSTLGEEAVPDAQGHPAVHTAQVADSLAEQRPQIQWVQHQQNHVASSDITQRRLE